MVSGHMSTGIAGGFGDSGRVDSFAQGRMARRGCQLLLKTCSPVIESFPTPEVRLEVFSAHPKDLLEYECEAIAIHPWPEIQVDRLRHIPRRALRRLLAYDPVLVRTLRRHRLDLLAYSTLGAQSDVNTLQWQPDFQHKRLPQFFSAKERATRDAAIAESRRWGNLLLSSHSAVADFRRYYPELASVQTHVLQFSTASILDVVPMSRAELETRYPVHEPYFYLPNQFWQHKNHAVVIQALTQTPASGYSR